MRTSSLGKLRQLEYNMLKGATSELLMFHLVGTSLQIVTVKNKIDSEKFIPTRNNISSQPTY